MAFSSAQYLLHETAVAVDIDDSCPVLDPDGIDFHLDPRFYVAFLTDLKVFQLEDGCFSSLHAGH